MKVIDRQLNPAETQTVHAVGRYIWLKSGTGPIYIKSSRGESARLDPSEFTTFDGEFSDFVISDLSGNTNDLTLVIADSPVAAGKYGSVTVQRSGTFDHFSPVVFGGAAGRSRLLAANSDRFRGIIRSDAANTATIWIGSSTVANETGIPLLPGESLALETSAEVWGWCNDATAPRVFAVQESK